MNLRLHLLQTRLRLRQRLEFLSELYDAYCSGLVSDIDFSKSSDVAGIVAGLKLTSTQLVRFVLLINILYNFLRSAQGQLSKRHVIQEPPGEVVTVCFRCCQARVVCTVSCPETTHDFGEG